MTIKTLAALLFYNIFIISPSFAKTDSWNILSLDEKAELLNNIDFIEENELPSGVQVKKYVDGQLVLPKDLVVTELSHKTYIDKMIETFESEVSTEEIEQSEYSAYGEPQISMLYLLIDSQGQILAGVLSFYQDGRDQQGEDSDVNWQALVRFDENAELLKDASGQTYDELYYDWTGH